MIEFCPQVVHSSHPDVNDFSDLSLTIDLMCSACKLSDEDLEEPCPGPPETWHP